MKFEIRRENFLKALTHGQNVVEKRTTVPILANTLLHAENGKLIITFTDLELSLIEAIDASVTQVGATTVPAHRLFEIVRKLIPGSDIACELIPDTQQLKLVSGACEFNISCLPADDFPTVQRTSLHHNFSMPAKDLFTVLDQVRFAMSNEEARYYLNGVLLHPKGAQEMRAVATDGHRLARASFYVSTNVEKLPPVIISRKCVNELAKLIGESEGAIDLSISDTQIAFTLGNAYLTSRLIDGTFPDYEAVIPKVNDKLLELDAKQLSESVDRVATMASDKEYGVRMNLSEGALLLSAVSSESGRAHEKISVLYSGEGLEIGFNARYLLDIFHKSSSGRVEIALSDASSPVLIRDPGNSAAIFVVMPMRV
ncbi:MAG: DNA polymerase III subunit beta [Alphaproteobacteria bacterium]|nr:MAG: DNA polymerase III subunit beta [Alphaproteobacteria bacterium]